MHLIVGVDPGVYTAYAALDMHGELVEAGCEKELSHEDLVRIISSLGKPSMIATDVSPAPDFVMRIASRFHVRLFVPERSLQVEEKKKIGSDIQNPHIRDAYAAAVKAYRNHESTLTRIEKSDTVLYKDLIKHLVLQGHSAAEAEFILTKKEEKKIENGEKKVAPQKQKRDERVLSLLSENENLRKALEMERGSRKSLEEKLRKSKSSRTTEVSRDREVQRLKGQVARLQIYIARLKRRRKQK
ncbi:DUF460 domain-containing protein [Candidatus Micrarchaeota archaeon]|nr:DUF460 domain-containing protein [Candidatus Micrarchaeota archaeon]MBD3417909.1 DUF460 domain-containing protein [Candidatus Micrarchaeota archaeon]